MSRLPAEPTGAGHCRLHCHSNFRIKAITFYFTINLLALPAAAQDCSPNGLTMSRLVPSLENAVDPNPLDGDIVLPMPCGATLVLRHVCVPSEGYFGDLRIDLGCKDCGREKQGFMEGRRKGEVSGPFTLQDLPKPWRQQLMELAKTGDGRCPDPKDEMARGFYYFIGKYEISSFQWKVLMEGECPESGSVPAPDDLRPKTGISWFEAVDFTRRYTEWLLKNAPDSLPRFSGGRSGYIRLPTEAEWEYAARGGHRVSESQLNQKEFFPLDERPYGAYAVFTEPGAPKPPERLAWIGTKCPNPLGLYDTAGNAAEMVLEPFRFSLGFRLHGAVGGLISKGGSYRKRKPEIMPGRREELPFFLEDGAFRSSDLGFRVVLSSIVTSRDRYEALDKEWLMAGVRGPGPAGESDGSAENDAEKPETTLKESESVRAIIQSALFTAESVVNRSIRRQAILYELDRLKYIKTRPLPEPALEALDGNIATVIRAIEDVDSEINNSALFYLHRINETQKYPVEIFENQMALVSRELSLEEGFSQGVKSRFELFQVFERHVAMHRNDAQGLSRETVLQDILPMAVR